MTAFIFGDQNNPDFLPAAKSILTILDKIKKKASSTEQAAKLLEVPVYNQLPSSYDAIDMIISLGGDGTVLRAGQIALHYRVPLLGINIGRLGFLTRINLLKDLHHLDSILSGSYDTHDLPVLSCKINDAPETLCLNEITLHRGSFPHLIDTNISINDTFLNTFSGDGLILATSSGATGYALSAGAPIICPDTEAFVIAPICPHTTSKHTVIVSSKHHITIQYTSGPKSIPVLCDGKETSILTQEDTLYCSLSPQYLTLLQPVNYDYFSTLRSKLRWTGRLR